MVLDSFNGEDGVYGFTVEAVSAQLGEDLEPEPDLS
jgi:hypothetical protein